MNRGLGLSQWLVVEPRRLQKAAINMITYFCLKSDWLAEIFATNFRAHEYHIHLRYITDM